MCVACVKKDESSVMMSFVSGVDETRQAESALIVKTSSFHNEQQQQQQTNVTLADIEAK